MVCRLPGGKRVRGRYRLPGGKRVRGEVQAKWR